MADEKTLTPEEAIAQAVAENAASSPAPAAEQTPLYATDVPPQALAVDIDAAAALAPLEGGISKEERRRREAARQLYFWTRGIYPKSTVEGAQTPVPFPGVQPAWSAQGFKTEGTTEKPQPGMLPDLVARGMARVEAGPSDKTPGFGTAIRGAVASGMAGWSQMLGGTPQEYRQEVPASLWDRLRNLGAPGNDIPGRAQFAPEPEPQTNDERAAQRMRWIGLEPDTRTKVDLTRPPNYALVSAGTPMDPVGNIRLRMPELAGISDSVILQAIGLESPGQDHIEASLVGTIRRAIEKTAPEWTNLGAAAGKYREDHPVRSFAAGVVPFVAMGGKTPGAVASNAIGGTGKAAGLLRFAAIPAEAAALTPGGIEERRSNAAYAAAVGLGLHAGGKAIGKGLRAAGVVKEPPAPPPITSPESRAEFNRTMLETSAAVNRMKAEVSSDPEVVAHREAAAQAADDLAAQTQRGVEAHRAEAGSLADLTDQQLENVVGGARGGTGSLHPTPSPPPPPAHPAGAVISSAMGGSGSSSLGNRHVESVRWWLRSFYKDRFARITAWSENAGNAFNNAAAGRSYGAVLSHIWQRQVVGGLDETERDLFERYLWHQRAVGKKAELARTGGNPNSVTLPELSPADLATVKASANIQEAARRHQEVWAQVEALRDALNPQRAKAETPDDLFINLVYDRDLHGPNVRRVPANSTSMPRSFNIGKGGHNQYAKLSGQPQYYVQDYGVLLSHAITDDFRTYGRRELINTLKSEGLAYRRSPKNPNPPADPYTDPFGKEHGWELIQARPSRFVTPPNGEPIAAPAEEYWVPKPVAKHYNALMKVREESWQTLNESLAPLFKVMDYRTGAQLASPVEATRHSLRVLSILSRLPGVDEGRMRRAFNMLPTYFGPRLSRVYDMMNVANHPDADVFTQWMGRVGAAPDRAYAESDLPGGMLSKQLHKGRDFLFSPPDPSAKGMKWVLAMPMPARLWGFDVRARLVAAKMFWEHAKVQGLVPQNADLADFAIGKDKRLDREFREFINGFGQFTQELQPAVVDFLRRTRLNPFIAAQSRMRPTEIAQMFGMHGLPTKGAPFTTKAALTGETLLRGTLGTLIPLALLNYQLSGKWPWQNEPGQMANLNTGVIDKTTRSAVYIPLNLIDPALSRSSRTTGLRYVSDPRYGAGLGDRLVNATGTRIFNEFLSTVAGGPGVQAMSIAATGRTPYLTENGEFLRVSRPAFGAGEDLLNRGKAVIATSNPNAEALIDTMLEEMGQEPWVVQHGNPKDPRLEMMFFGGRMILGQVATMGQPPEVQKARLYWQMKSKMDEVLSVAATEYMRAGSNEEKSIVMNRTLAKFPKGLRGEAALALQKKLIGRVKGPIVGGMKSEVYRQLLEQE